MELFRESRKEFAAAQFLQTPFGGFNQAKPKPLDHHAVMVVTTLRAAAVRQTTKVGEPFEISGAKTEPFSGSPDGFNDRKVTSLSCGDRLHLLRLGYPFGDRPTTRVSAPRRSKLAVVAKKLNHVPLSWTGLAGKMINVSLGYSRNPAPRFAQRSRAAQDNLVCGRFAGKERSGDLAQEQRAAHGKWRCNAPTSPTLLEQACALAQLSSCDELPVIHIPLGYPQRGRDRNPKARSWPA